MSKHSLEATCHVDDDMLKQSSTARSSIGSEERLMAQALAQVENRVAEVEGLLNDAKDNFDAAEIHRKSAQKQLDAQEEDFGRLGMRLKVPLPSFIPFSFNMITTLSDLTLPPLSLTCPISSLM